MTLYELIRLSSTPFLPALYYRAMRDLRRLISNTDSNRPLLLDVGGRSSPYTVGLTAEITVLDIPSNGQTRLGMTDEILNKLKTKRSNVVNVILEDMTKCSLPSDSFDGVICVEVLEHVKDENAFISNIHRVLKKGGWLYLTTPNYDYRKDLKIDGKIEIKFYRKQDL